MGGMVGFIVEIKSVLVLRAQSLHPLDSVSLVSFIRFLQLLFHLVDKFLVKHWFLPLQQPLLEVELAFITLFHFIKDRDTERCISQPVNHGHIIEDVNESGSVVPRADRAVDGLHDVVAGQS